MEHIIDNIIAYFATIPSLHRSLMLIGGLTFFLTLEAGVPLFRFSNNKLKHIGLNLFFNVTTIIVNLAFAFILIESSKLVIQNKFGVLQWLTLPVWLQLIVGLMLMDFIAAYLIHYIEHKIWWMWQFHTIHHTDQYVDVTTGNRHHPGESVLRFISTCIVVILVGTPIWLIMLYQALSVIFTQLTHANIVFPRSLSNILDYVFVTPEMHRIHHHYRQPYSDQNYGNIFSIWDRMFGTFVRVDNRKLKYGLDTHMNPDETNTIGGLLKLPFKKYRGHIQYEEEEKL